MVTVGYKDGKAQYNASTAKACEGCCGGEPEIECERCLLPVGTVIRATFADVLYCSDDSEITDLTGNDWDMVLRFGSATQCIYEINDSGLDFLVRLVVSTSSPANLSVSNSAGTLVYYVGLVGPTGACATTASDVDNDNVIGDCGGVIAGYDGTASWSVL